jgi:hypothetical protein
MDQAFVADILDRLSAAGIDCLLFGGWAEEVFELYPPRLHGDVDLLWRADSFDLLDSLLARDFTEITAKRFAHKRAFTFQDVMIEITRVEPDNDDLVTWFWGDVRYVWLQPLTESHMLAGRACHIVSPANLQRFRALHKSTQPWRWREPASLQPQLVSIG